MRTTKAERIHAERFSEAVDRLVRDPDAEPEAEAGGEALLRTAQQLARLPALLGPVNPELERQISRRVQIGTPQPSRLRRLRPAGAAAGLVVLLTIVMLLTPLGQTAVASFRAVFDLGRTQVRITPVDTPSALLAREEAESAAILQTMTLAEAREQVSFALPQPSYLPAGYRLREAVSYTFPELPTWVPQPLFVAIVYENDGGDTLTLRIYPIMLGNQANISGLNLQAAPIQAVQNVEVSGQPGMLLQLGAGGPDDVWQEIVWEQDDLILALSATNLNASELVRAAESVR